MDLASGIPIAIEPHPYTLEEALRMLEHGHPTIVDALEEGEVLYSGPGLATLLEKFNTLKRRGN